MSKIQWTDVTDNPIYLKKPDGSHGGHWCRKVSEGCANCYAETINNSSYFGFASHLSYAGEPPANLHFDAHMIDRWMHVKKPQKRFVCSMTDLFGEWVPEDWQDMVFYGAQQAPNQVIQLLTKRPDVALKAAQRWCDRLGQRLPANVWMGCTIENQRQAIARVEAMRELSRYGWTWVSYEPALSYVDWEPWMSFVQWLVVGAESGKDARWAQEWWFESAINDCKEANLPIFVKQLGKHLFVPEESASLYSAKCFYNDLHMAVIKFKDRTGSNPDEWGDRFRVRQFPIQMYEVLSV